MPEKKPVKKTPAKAAKSAPKKGAAATPEIKTQNPKPKTQKTTNKKLLKRTKTAKPQDVAVGQEVKSSPSQPISQKPIPQQPRFTGTFFYANGKRKTSVARVRLYTANKGGIVVNDRPIEKYFPVMTDQDKIISPLRITESLNLCAVDAVVIGGGVHSQAEAVRHGIAKALVAYKPEFRGVLKHALFLRRDSRVKERKKFGLKRARRAPQWSKR